MIICVAKLYHIYLNTMARIKTFCPKIINNYILWNKSIWNFTVINDSRYILTVQLEFFDLAAKLTLLFWTKSYLNGHCVGWYLDQISSSRLENFREIISHSSRESYKCFTRATYQWILELNSRLWHHLMVEIRIKAPPICKDWN